MAGTSPAMTLRRATHSNLRSPESDRLSFVMPGLVPGIHVFMAPSLSKTWMAGPTGAKTALRAFRPAMTLRRATHSNLRSPESDCLSSVMPALVAGIHVFAALQQFKTWMAGTSPAMTRLLDLVADQLLNVTPVMASRLPCQIFSLSAFGMSMPSMMRKVSRVYIVPFSGSNGQSEANTILSAS